MRILYFDCFAGISGDMNLGALIDLGVPADYLNSELKKLNFDGYNLHVEQALKMGINGTKVTVELIQPKQKTFAGLKVQTLDAAQENEPHAHPHPHSHAGSHVHRNLSDIYKIIDSSNLCDFVKEKSRAMFHEIGVAEAKIHAKELNEIHFHEVGAVDSIVDIVGAAICIDYLKPDKIYASTIELGGGFVKCAHGTFPVPAPATAEILKGIPVHKGAVDKETTTPTGAAILKVFVDEFIDQIHFTIEKIAYGLGHRDMSIPNVLRAYLGEMQTGNVEKVKAQIISCNIDDMNPELYDYIMDKLFQAGAQDVFMVPMMMKKSRPAIQLNVLCDRECESAIEDILWKETTTLGLRTSEVSKKMLSRTIRMVETAYGPIQIKEAYLSDKVFKFKAEYEDCIKAARTAGVSLKDIYSEVDRVLNSKINKS